MLVLYDIASELSGQISFVKPAMSLLSTSAGLFRHLRVFFMYMRATPTSCASNTHQVRAQLTLKVFGLHVDRGSPDGSRRTNKRLSTRIQCLTSVKQPER